MALKSIENAHQAKVDAGTIISGTKIDITGEPLETEGLDQ
jgi:hypothetical protein